MHYSMIKECDIANGIGVRNSIWVSGCPHHCFNCFNQEAWDYDYGKLYTDNIRDYIISISNKSYIDGISILGGEPLSIPNRDTILDLCISFKDKLPNKSIWVYSGYTIEELLSNNTTLSILYNIDILVDGKFIDELKDSNLRYRGSSNQRIINTKEYLSGLNSTI